MSDPVAGSWQLMVAESDASASQGGDLLDRLRCAVCGEVAWRRDHVAVLADPERPRGPRIGVLSGGVEAGTGHAWRCTCGRSLPYDDPVTAELDALVSRTTAR